MAYRRQGRRFGADQPREPCQCKRINRH
jgi:hypothetical protein